MKSAFVLTALLTLATAARIPSEKLDSQNELIQENYESGDYASFQEQEERDSIAGSFDPIVTIMHQYKNDLASNKEFINMKNEIAVPDTINVGGHADTYLSNIRVKGLKDFDSQNISMSWTEDVVIAENSWKQFTINGVYHYINSASRFSGEFDIVLVEPKYRGNTSLTKNANIYPMMSPASFITFKTAVINHTKLPEAFQNEKPHFDYFIKNVVCQYVATAVSADMYKDITMRIRQAIRPYLTYKNNKIAADDAAAAAPVTGKLSNGQFELKNIRLDGSKNYYAKIAYARMNCTEDYGNTAKLQLRLLGLAGESDLTVTADNGKTYGAIVAFKFDRVKVVPYVDLDEKTVRTDVIIAKTPQIEMKLGQGSDSDSLSWMNNAKEQLTNQLADYFVQKLAETTSQKIQQTMQ